MANLVSIMIDRRMTTPDMSNVSSRRSPLTGKALEGLVTAASSNPLALAQLAFVVANQGNHRRAATLAHRALEAAPADRRIQTLALETLRIDVPAWHFKILQDEARLQAYDAALRRAVTPGCRVLDIGTGTGVLAMMAARAGAGQVIACEVNPVVADLAQRIVALNGYADRVTVLCKHSTDLDVADIGGRVDVLVTEIIGENLISEGVLGVLEDAAARLLRPHGQIIPARGEVRVALAHHPEKSPQKIEWVEGFDLRPFNCLARSTQVVSVDDPQLSIGSRAASLFDFDFQSGGPFHNGVNVIELTADGGPVNGIVQWFRLQLDSQGVYENHPSHDTRSSWSALFHSFAHTRELARGTTMTIHGDRHRNSIRIWSEE